MDSDFSKFEFEEKFEFFAFAYSKIFEILATRAFSRPMSHSIITPTLPYWFVCVCVCVCACVF